MSESPCKSESPAGTAKPIEGSITISDPEPGFPNGRRFAECVHCGDQIIWSESYLMWNHYSQRIGFVHACNCV